MFRAPAIAVRTRRIRINRVEWIDQYPEHLRPDCDDDAAQRTTTQPEEVDRSRPRRWRLTALIRSMRSSTVSQTVRLPSMRTTRHHASIRRRLRSRRSRHQASMHDRGPAVGNSNRRTSLHSLTPGYSRSHAPSRRTTTARTSRSDGQSVIRLGCCHRPVARGRSSPIRDRGTPIPVIDPRPPGSSGRRCHHGSTGSG